MDKIIFIDRDGVINVDILETYVTSAKDFRFEEGAIEGLRNLHEFGYQIIVISNQAGVGDGIFTKEALQEVHTHMVQSLKKENVPITAAYYCPHGKEAGCKCRKPETGLFEKAAEHRKFNKEETFFIGDKASDMEAGKRFGLKTFFVRTGHGKNHEPKLQGDLKPDLIADNLLEASKILVGKKT